jgi:hypothetical protein
MHHEYLDSVPGFGGQIVRCGDLTGTQKPTEKTLWPKHYRFLLVHQISSKSTFLYL